MCLIYFTVRPAMILAVVWSCDYKVCQVITLLSYVSNHKVQLGVVVYLAMWLIIQLTGYVTSTSSMANPDPEVGLAEGYTMRHMTVPLDLICTLGFASD